MLKMLPAIALGFALATSAPAQQPIPVRHLTDIVATDSGVLGDILGVRGLPRGRVLVSDWGHHRLVVFDSSMKRFTVTTDSVAGAANAYGSDAALILPYLRDSTVFVDQQSRAFIVLDPLGRMVRSMAPPSARAYTGVSYGASVGAAFPQGYDPDGRLLYQTAISRPRAQTPPPVIGTVLVHYDSSAIVRVDAISHKSDTLGLLMTNGVRKGVIVPDSIEHGGCGMINPLPQFDQWTLLPDGTVAILRTIDYHIDWIHDGKTTSTPKMPFDWRRVTDGEKQALLDSAHRAYDARIAKARAGPVMGVGGVVRQMGTPCPFIPLDLESMPDYYPPNPRFYGHSVFADRAGNVWILPSTSLLASEGLAFDVVNRKGQIFERVIVPAGRTIAGFGADGIVYLHSYYSSGAARLERGRISK